jgi:hypothetical protein
MLERIAIEKYRAVSEFMRRMALLQQQEAALTQRPEPSGPYVRMVRPKSRRAS